MSLTMRYDREDDVLMIWFIHGRQIDHAEQVGQGILHISAQGEPVLLEILQAREFVPELVRTVMLAESAGAGSR
jgi:hypothetical protein